MSRTIVRVSVIIVAVSAWKSGPVTGPVSATSATAGGAVQPNIVALGELLYSRFLFTFELAGLILLVAMIGAIVLTHRSRGDVRGQNVARQVDRDPAEAIKNLNPAVGEGMKL